LSLVPYDENENLVTERYYFVTKFCIVTSKTSWIRVFVLVSPLARQGWFSRSGSRGGFRGGIFDRCDDMVCVNPSLEQMT
jgi:hypothetical protein